MFIVFNLINDDCMNVLCNIKDNSIDLIITDPPYEYANGGGRWKRWLL